MGCVATVGHPKLTGLGGLQDSVTDLKLPILCVFVNLDFRFASLGTLESPGSGYCTPLAFLGGNCHKHPINVCCARAVSADGGTWLGFRDS